MINRGEQFREVWALGNCPNWLHIEPAGLIFMFVCSIVFVCVVCVRMCSVCSCVLECVCVCSYVYHLYSSSYQLNHVLVLVCLQVRFFLSVVLLFIIFQVYRQLVKANPVMHVYKKEDFPERFHYGNHPRNLPIIGFLDPGWHVHMVCLFSPILIP